uniref:Striatin N-terminal domain-containing protein n=1 Tax=Oryzias melastigma TaxID=30732 RepID=A0A3B3DAV3_ORYME
PGVSTCEEQRGGRSVDAQIAFLQGERRGQENLKKDLVRRIKMLEYVLKQERAKHHKLKFGTELLQGGIQPPSYDSGESSRRGACRQKPAARRSPEAPPTSCPDHESFKSFKNPSKALRILQLRFLGLNNVSV